MKKRLPHKLTEANVIARLALFLALGGGAALAATSLPKHSVGTAQLKGGAVTGAKVADGSLLATDFKAGAVPAGPRRQARPRRHPGSRRRPRPPGRARCPGSPGRTRIPRRAGRSREPRRNRRRGPAGQPRSHRPEGSSG